MNNKTSDDFLNDDNNYIPVTSGEVTGGNIQKWKDIVDCLENAETDSDCTGLENSSSNCALCFTHPDCDNCPVYLFTGVIGCACTPYVDFISTCSISEKKRIAKKELEFLKSLRSYED